MGTSIDVTCTKCGLEGEEIMWGIGMLPIWSLFEHRLYHCKSCSSLRSAMVLRPERELKSSLDQDPGRWAQPAAPMTQRELAELLMDARRWPRCGDGCGGRLFGSVREGSDGQPTGCPVCGGRLQVSPGVLLWD